MDRNATVMTRFDEGIECFQKGDFWTAHEKWEEVWRKLKDPYATYIKALIQSAAVFHLLSLERDSAAERLALRSLELFSGAEAHFQLQGLQPIFFAPELEDTLLKIAASLKVGHIDREWFARLGRSQKFQWRTREHGLPLLAD
ncbi:MAG: DUF309 domain-containing protein [Proteobacteria bacterium]|nr:MAG: DUF309 domain-containing protein [Pseudomonadota bacterium]